MTRKSGNCECIAT